MESFKLLLSFSTYFFTGIVMLMAFLIIYSRITPYDEWRLIKANNEAAAIGFSGASIGYVTPLASAAINSVSLIDYLIWGGVALVAQLFIFFVVFLAIPHLGQRIENNEKAAGIFLCAASICGGILNAACMSY